MCGFRIFRWLLLASVAQAICHGYHPSLAYQTDIGQQYKKHRCNNTITTVIDTFVFNNTDGAHSIEWRLIDEIMKKLKQNFSMQNYRSSVQSNSDIHIGTWSTADSPPAVKYTTSSIYDIDTTVWCVSHAKLLPKWMYLFRLYKDPIVLLFFILLFYMSVAWYYFYMNRYERWNYDFHKSTLYVLQAITAQSMPIRPTFLKTRLIALFTLYMSMVIDTTVVALYMVSMHRDYSYYQTHTMVDLIDGRFQLAGNAEARDAVAEAATVRMKIHRCEYLTVFCLFFYYP